MLEDGKEEAPPQNPLSSGRELCKEMISVWGEGAVAEGGKGPRGTTEGGAHLQGG